MSFAPNGRGASSSSEIVYELLLRRFSLGVEQLEGAEQLKLWEGRVACIRTRRLTLMSQMFDVSPRLAASYQVATVVDTCCRLRPRSAPPFVSRVSTPEAAVGVLCCAVPLLWRVFGPGANFNISRKFRGASSHNKLA